MWSGGNTLTSQDVQIRHVFPFSVHDFTCKSGGHIFIFFIIGIRFRVPERIVPFRISDSIRVESHR